MAKKGLLRPALNDSLRLAHICSFNLVESIDRSKDLKWIHFTVFKAVHIDLHIGEVTYSQHLILRSVLGLSWALPRLGTRPFPLEHTSSLLFLL